ncbi:MAG: cytochrome c3 family protein [Actinomycetota bacterium]
MVKAHPYGHRIEVMGVCTGCHDPHSVTKAAPVWGASGVEPVYGPMTTYTLLTHVVNDYQLCFKCHSGAAVPMVGTKNVAEEVNPANQSYLAIMAAGRRTDMPAGSFVAPWTQTSRLKCGDCHGRDAAAQQQLRHGSANAYLLKKPYAGLPPSNSNLLCYSCHTMAFYGPGAASVGAYSWSRANSGNSHRVHSNAGTNCVTCHDMHGSATRPGMIKPDMNMTGNAPGPFLCTTGCH